MPSSRQAAARGERFDGKLFNIEKFIAQSAIETLFDTVLPEFIDKEIRQWFRKLGVKTLYIKPGSRLSILILATRPTLFNAE